MIPQSIILDADRIRETVNTDLGFSEEDRWTQNVRLARLATEIESQGFHVIVASVCPYKKLRQKLKEDFLIYFIELQGGKDTMNCPYEKS